MFEFQFPVLLDILRSNRYFSLSHRRGKNRIHRHALSMRPVAILHSWLLSSLACYSHFCRRIRSGLHSCCDFFLRPSRPFRLVGRSTFKSWNDRDRVSDGVNDFPARLRWSEAIPHDVRGVFRRDGPLDFDKDVCNYDSRSARRKHAATANPVRL